MSSWMSWFLIHFRMFLRVMQWSNHCQTTVSFGKSFWWMFLFGLRPLLCVWFVVSLDETQVWLGICGSSGWSLCCLVCCDLPAFPDPFGPCTNWRFTAYAHVRTEPQCDIGHTRGKKQHDGNEHFSSVFLDQSWSSSLHPFQNCDGFVFAQVSFPLFYGPLCQWSRLRWDHSGRWGSQCREECTIGQCGGGHCCKGRDGSAYVTLFYLIGGGCFLRYCWLWVCP